MEESPQESLRVKGEIYAKLGRSVEELENSQPRSIFNYDFHHWKLVKR